MNSHMVLGILAEPSGEHRVSMAPVSVEAAKKLGFERVLIASDAGGGAHFSDALYREKGAEPVSAGDLLQQADVLIGIHPLSAAQIASLPGKKVLIHQIGLGASRETAEAAAAGGHTLMAIDLIPRTTRAQAMDVLSSMATVAGYEAVLLAATRLDRFFPMFMSAAGTIPPSRILVLGAGVAGLQAIATARKLGGVVEAFDVRRAAKEEAQSLGAKFIEVEGAADDSGAGGYAVEQSEEFLAKQRQLVHDHAVKSDVVITTAQIPGKKAPELLEKRTVDAMRPGSVIVDMAASTGGNCSYTVNNDTIVHKGITIIGDSNLAARMPADASTMYGRNLLAYLKLFFVTGNWSIPMEDDIVAASCVTHEGQWYSERFKQLYL